MSRYKHFIGFCSAAFLLAMLFLQPEVVLFGVQTASAQVPLTITGGIISIGSFIGTVVVTVLNVLMWMLFMILDRIMDPNWIFDLENGMGLTLMLRNIWQLCRDLVNLGMALALIFAAIHMIVTADSSKIKEKLPKFVMALVLVNFSWFLPRVVFDVSQVLTYTVYQIPSMIGADGCVMPATATAPAQPCEAVVNMAFFQQATNVVPGINGWSCPLPGIVCLQSVPIGSPQNPSVQMHSQVMNGLIVNHARMRTLIRVVDPAPVGEDIGAAMIFLIKVLVILIIHLFIFFPVLALTVAFFIRIPILWVTMAFMPLAAVSYVFGESLHLGDMDPKKLFMEQFISMAFLPVKVAIPFTIGFIMLNAAASTPAPAAFSNVPPIAVISGVSSLWQIIWMLVAISIIYRYSFKALAGGGEFIEPWVNSIKQIGDSAQEYAKKLPLSVPFIPVGGGRAGSLLDLGRAADPRAAVNELGQGGQRRNWFQRLQAQVDQRNNAGGNGNQGAAAGVNNAHAEQVRAAVGNFGADVRQNLQAGIAAGVAPGGNALNAVRNAVQTARTASPNRMAGMNDLSVLQGIMNHLNLNAAQQNLLRNAARGLPGQGLAELPL